MMKFDKIIITSKRNLLKYREDISRLFYEVFHKELVGRLWEWAYIENVCGEPIVSLFYHNGKLIGHYGIIPIILRYNSSNILAALSMTTMVAPTHHRLGIFTEQAALVYEKAKKSGFLLVYGFPNSNSEPGFRKRLGWTIRSDSRLIRVQGKYLMGKKFHCGTGISFNGEDKELLNWRLSKPDKLYAQTGGLILNYFNDEIDIVFHENEICNIDEEKYYNIFLDDVFINTFDKYEVVDYTFGYKIFDKKMFDCKFKVDLILSDIF